MRPRIGFRSHSVTTAEVAPDELLDRGQRRVLLGLCIGLGAATTVPASYNYVLIPMLDGLGASESQGSLLRQLPSIGGLLVILRFGRSLRFRTHAIEAWIEEQERGKQGRPVDSRDG